MEGILHQNMKYTLVPGQDFASKNRITGFLAEVQIYTAV